MGDGVDGTISVNRQINAGRKRAFEADIGDAVRSSCRTGGKHFTWQITRGQHERARANHTAKKIPAVTLVAKQGNIFDGNHEPLRFFSDFQCTIVPPIRILATARGIFLWL